MVVVYAAPTVSRRSCLWERLNQVVGGTAEPVFVGGDFNTIVRLDERTDGNGRLSQDSLAFGEWINGLSLIDMGFKGGQFTWRRGKSTNTFIAKRLDRVLCCAQSRLRWPEAVVSHLPFLASDHAPMYLQMNLTPTSNSRRKPDMTTPKALAELQKKLRKWNKEVFGNIQLRKEKMMGEIKGIQDLLMVSQSDLLLAQEEKLLTEFDIILEQEETLWFQKSRGKFLALGDRNTSFFHTSIVIRRRKNKIEALKNGDDRWIIETKELKTLALDYYRRLYSLDDVNVERGYLPMNGFMEMTREEK